MKLIKYSLIFTALLATGCAQIPIRKVNTISLNAINEPNMKVELPQKEICSISMYNPILDKKIQNEIKELEQLEKLDSQLNASQKERAKKLYKSITQNEKKHEKEQRKRCDLDAYYKLNIPISEKDHLNANMFILEINDQGVIVNPEVKEAILRHLKTEMEKPTKPNVNLFVHGWNNNADANNTDLINFEKAVALLKTSSDPKSDATGIYVSWRAKTLPTGAHLVTFWDRKAISEEVGRGELGNFIFELESVVKPDQSKAEDNGKLILAGHSFGASALYNAVGHTLTARFYDSLERQKTDSKQPIRGIGDIVILLNPAIEALRFRGLREAVYEKANTQPEIFKNNKSPIMVVLASEDDIHVETAFPIGRLMGQLFTHYNQKEIKIHSPNIVNDTSDSSHVKKAAVPLRSTQRQSIGFFEPYYTHYVINNKKTNHEPENKPKEALESVTNTLNKVSVINDTGVTKVLNPKYLLGQVKDSLTKTTSRSINYESCLSTEAKNLYEQAKTKGNLPNIDWFDIIYKQNSNTENFSTKIKSRQSNQDVDLFYFQISNNPALFPEDIKTSWNLIKDKPNQPLTWKQNPYWFVKTKSDFMQGHNGIWNANVGCLLMVLMTNSSNMPKPTVTVQHSNDPSQQPSKEQPVDQSSATETTIIEKDESTSAIITTVN